jgi:hypothetical protein
MKKMGIHRAGPKPQDKAKAAECRPEGAGTGDEASRWRHVPLKMVQFLGMTTTRN